MGHDFVSQKVGNYFITNTIAISIVKLCHDMYVRCSVKKSRPVKKEIRLNQILTNEYTKLHIHLGMNSNFTQNDKN